MGTTTTTARASPPLQPQLLASEWARRRSSGSLSAGTANNPLRSQGSLGSLGSQSSRRSGCKAEPVLNGRSQSSTRGAASQFGGRTQQPPVQPQRSHAALSGRRRFQSRGETSAEDASALGSYQAMSAAEEAALRDSDRGRTISELERDQDGPPLPSASSKDAALEEMSNEDHPDSYQTMSAAEEAALRDSDRGRTISELERDQDGPPLPEWSAQKVKVGSRVDEGSSSQAAGKTPRTAESDPQVPRSASSGADEKGVQKGNSPKSAGFFGFSLWN